MKPLKFHEIKEKVFFVIKIPFSYSIAIKGVVEIAWETFFANIGQKSEHDLRIIATYAYCKARVTLFMTVSFNGFNFHHS